MRILPSGMYLLLSSPKNWILLYKGDGKWQWLKHQETQLHCPGVITVKEYANYRMNGPLLVSWCETSCRFYQLQCRSQRPRTDQKTGNLVQPQAVLDLQKWCLFCGQSRETLLNWPMFLGTVVEKEAPSILDGVPAIKPDKMLNVIVLSFISNAWQQRRENCNDPIKNAKVRLHVTSLVLFCENRPLISHDYQIGFYFVFSFINSPENCHWPQNHFSFLPVIINSKLSHTQSFLFPAVLHMPAHSRYVTSSGRDPVLFKHSSQRMVALHIVKRFLD